MFGMLFSFELQRGRRKKDAFCSGCGVHCLSFAIYCALAASLPCSGAIGACERPNFVHTPDNNFDNVVKAKFNNRTLFRTMCGAHGNA